MEELAEGMPGWDSGVFRARLAHLQSTVHPPGRGPYSDKEVVALMADRGLESMSSVHFWKLRTGRTGNPRISELAALATFFGVPLMYWFSDQVAEQSNKSLEKLVLMRDAGIESILLRLSDVSEDGQAAVSGLLDHYRKREGLPPVK